MAAAIRLALELPRVRHTNRLDWEGCLTLIGTPSDQEVKGSGHRVIISHKAASQALSSLLGMGVNLAADDGRHQRQRKCGVITSAALDDSRILVSGFLYARDFPEVVEACRTRTLGMSFEMDCRARNERAAIWDLTGIMFTGAAVIDCVSAAYQKTYFRLTDPDSAGSAGSTRKRLLIEG